MPYPDMGGSYAPMMGISGMGGGTPGGISPFGGQPGMQSNQQFQDPMAWLQMMLQTQPGLAGTSASPGTPGATVSPGQAASQAPSSPFGDLGGLLGGILGQARG